VDTPSSSVSSAATSSLLYGLEDRLPFGTALLVSLQQVSAMIVGTITPPLIVAGVLGLSPSDTAYTVSMAFLASALGTLLQTLRPGPIGSGLLSVTGTSFSFLQPLIAAGKIGGLPLMLGMAVSTAPLQLLLAPLLPRLRHVFTPLVSGVVVLLIGLSLIPSAMIGIGAPVTPGAPIWSGALVAVGVLGILVAAQAIGKPWARLGGVIFGVLFGYGLCAAFGWLNAPPPSEAGGWVWPRLNPHGLAFRWELALPFLFIYFVSLLEAMGDMTATSQLSGLPTEGPQHWARLRGGILADGLTSLISGLCGAFPSTTYAQNNGVIQITGVASRRIGPIMAAILALLGVVPAVGRWVTVMPPPVLGALALLLFGLVAVSGLRLIATPGIGHREAVIVAVSLGVGLALPTATDWLAKLPFALRAVLESGIATGGMTALGLNLILRKTLPAESVAAAPQ